VRLAKLMAVAMMVVVVAVLTSGCGSGGAVQVPTGGDTGAFAKIVEYRGDGGGSAKPWPAFIPGAPTDQPMSKAPKLGLDAGFFTRAVPRRHISWYRIGQLSTAETVVVLLQPIADQDADLFVLAGTGSTYVPGAAILGFSIRPPTDPGGEPGMFGAGLVPDWVAFDFAPTNKAPAAQIAVFGTDLPPNKKSYRIEACGAWDLVVNGPSAGSIALKQYASNFWRFDATAGTQYTVSLTVNAGDPDIYVYEDASTEYVGANANVGGGTVTFTAGDTCRHYIRVHGYSGADSSYGVNVTSP